MNPTIVPKLQEAMAHPGASGHLVHVITANHFGWHAGLVVRQGRFLHDVLFSGHDDANPTLPATDNGYWVEVDPTRGGHIVEYTPSDDRLEAAARTLLKPNYPHGGSGRYYRLGEQPIAEALEDWRQVSKAVNRALSGMSFDEARTWVANGGMDKIYDQTRPAPGTRPLNPPGRPDRGIE